MIPPQNERTRVWTAICYPWEEDDRNGHFAFLNWLIRDLHYLEYAYIEHEPDTEEGKKHIHLVMRFPQKVRFNGVNKFCGGIFNENLLSPVSSVCGYGLYMLHQDFNSIRQGKNQYNPTDIIGTETLLSDLLVTTSKHNNISLSITTLISNLDLMNVGDVVQAVLDNCDDPVPFIDFITNRTFFVKTLCEENRSKKLGDIQRFRNNYNTLVKQNEIIERNLKQ